MRKYLKILSSQILIPLTRWYLRKERKYTYRGSTVHIFPGVFHPGLFSSTHFLLDYLQHQDLENTTFLELGSGSGLISVMAAKANARVTASDLSIHATKNTITNAKLNNVSIEVIQSDLFDGLASLAYDWIVINPPYYAQAPKTEAELAWHCGENFEYFQKLFKQLPNYMDRNTKVIMVLTKGCDLKKIFEIGMNGGFQFELIQKKKVLFDQWGFLYKVSQF